MLAGCVKESYAPSWNKTFASFPSSLALMIIIGRIDELSKETLQGGMVKSLFKNSGRRGPPLNYSAPIRANLGNNFAFFYSRLRAMFDVSTLVVVNKQPLEFRTHIQSIKHYMIKAARR